jgi:hypothetical protein
MAPLPPRPSRGPTLSQLLVWARLLLVDRRLFWHFAGLMLLGELMLGLLIIRFVPCEYPSQSLAPLAMFRN